MKHKPVKNHFCQYCVKAAIKNTKVSPNTFKIFQVFIIYFLERQRMFDSKLKSLPRLATITSVEILRVAYILGFTTLNVLYIIVGRFWLSTCRETGVFSLPFMYHIIFI